MALNDPLEINEFDLESMRRIATQIRRVEAMYQNLVVELSRIRYGDPKVPKTFLAEATEMIPARTSVTPGTGEVKVLRKLNGDIVDYLPDSNNEVLKQINNFTASAISLGQEILVAEDRFSELWAILGGESSTTIISEGGLSHFEISPNERLDPGESAVAYLLEWDGLAWVSTGNAHTLHDRDYRNFLVAGERCWAQVTPTNSTGTGTGTGTGSGVDNGWDIIGENGLKRTAVALEQIQGGASGLVQIYSGPMLVFGLPTCTRSATGAIVEACVLSGSTTVEVGDVLHIFYHPDHFKWIVSKKYDPGFTERLAFGILNTDLCGDGTGTGTDTAAGEDFVAEAEVTDVRYIDGTQPSPTTVTARNRFNKTGEVGDLVLLVRVTEYSSTGTGTGTGTTTATNDVWDIIEIRHRRTKIMTGLRHVPGEGLYGKFRWASIMRCGEFEELVVPTGPC